MPIPLPKPPHKGRAIPPPLPKAGEEWRGFREKLRWLFWLRWRLFLRGFSRDKGRVITTIIMIVFGVPFYLAIAAGTFLAYRFLPPPANMEVLFLVLTAAYFLWMVLPLFEFTVNEGLDISKLMLFPLTRPELMVSLLFSTLLDIPMFGLVLVLLAVIAGWAVSIPAALLTIVAVLIFYAQIVGMSQLVLALLMRSLQSRRFRDLGIILVALLSSSCYLLQQVVFRSVGNGNIVENLQRGTFSTYLQWLPPGMSARAISQAVAGNWGGSLLWLGMSLVASILVLYLWASVLERGLSTPEVGGAVRRRRRRTAREVGAGEAGEADALPYTPTQAPTAAGSIWRRIGSTQTFAIAVKELKYFWRDPQLKALMLSSLYIVIVLFAGPLFGYGGSSSSGWGSLTYTTPLAAFITVFTLSYNTLGIERQSLTTLFLFPIEPRRILFGKNLAVAVLGVVELVLLLVISGFLSRNWAFMLPVLVLGLAGIGVVLGCGNISSVFFPQRMRQIQRGMMASGASAGNAGCQRAIMSTVMMVVTVIVLIPVALALILPLLLHIQWVWVVTIPTALVYAVAFHQIVTRKVAPRMLARVPEILEVTTRE